MTGVSKFSDDFWLGSIEPNSMLTGPDATGGAPPSLAKVCFPKFHEGEFESLGTPPPGMERPLQAGASFAQDLK